MRRADNSCPLAIPNQSLHIINAHIKFGKNSLMFTRVIVRKRKYGRTDDRRTDGRTNGMTHGRRRRDYCTPPLSCGGVCKVAGCVVNSILIYTVCPDVSVRIFRVNTVFITPCFIKRHQNMIDDETWQNKKTKMSQRMPKPTKWHVHPAKTQISLGIRPGWSESLLSSRRNLWSLATH